MIPAGFIQDLLARTDIAEVIGTHVELKRSGANLSGLCPFHAETNPSFKITVRGQYQGKWRCFGSCNAGGDVIDFRARLSDITNLEKGPRGTGGPPGD